MVPLRSDGNAGFIFALVAFPLLERYIRNKSSCPEGEKLKPQFFAELGQMFSEILGKENAFWDCYRNGLLHQVTFPKAKLNSTSEQVDGDEPSSLLRLDARWLSAKVSKPCRRLRMLATNPSLKPWHPAKVHLRLTDNPEQGARTLMFTLRA